MPAPFSPGLEGVVAAQTEISEVDGQNGRLIYRGGYLIHELADRSFAEIAYLLGYADQSTFFRATHRWFGEPPGEYRTRVLGTYQQEIAAAHQK